MATIKKPVAKPVSKQPVTSVVPAKVNVAKFDEDNVPLFMRSPQESSTNALAALAPTMFPYLSIKGKRFALVRNREETPIMRADDDETPANAIEVVVINAAHNFSKVYYAGEFVDGSKDKPTCYSNSGDVPAPDAEDKQAQECATCEHNVWGSGRGGKGKACSDSLRVAIAFPAALNDPILLRVPPASLKNITEYAAMLSRKGVPIEGLITKIKFDAEEATPRLLFSPVAFVNDSQYKEALTVAKTSIVQQIIGSVPLQLQGPKEEEKDEVEEAKAPEKAVKKAAPTPASALASKLRESLRSAASDD